MSKTEETERSHQVAQRALELMRAHHSPAHPRGYEVWYTYVLGHKPQMNEALKRLTAEQGKVPETEIETLYETHLSPQRQTEQAEKTSAGVITEIDQVMNMLELALGSTAKYGQSLEALSHDLSGNVDRGQVRAIIGSLVESTREVAATNHSLDTRLKETRNEIESLRATLEAVRMESLTDALTGIGNRKHFEEMLSKGCELAEAKKVPLSLIVIDIDHFKRFNDTYGHLTGDQVIKLVAMTMREKVKAGATVARFGGEEFAIVMPTTTLDVAYSTAEEIRKAVPCRELVKKSTGESLGKVTISVGLAGFRKGDSPVTLLERADSCLYKAKNQGRNRTVADGLYGVAPTKDVA